MCLLMIYDHIWWFPISHWATPKSSIFMGFSIINHPVLGSPIYGHHHVNYGWYQAWSCQIISTIILKMNDLGVAPFMETTDLRCSWPGPRGQGAMAWHQDPGWTADERPPEVVEPGLLESIYREYRFMGEVVRRGPVEVEAKSWGLAPALSIDRWDF